MTVDQMIDDIIRREGGYVDHPADRGGPTKYGITQKTLSAFRGWKVLPIDVEMMLETEAREIYRRNYYLAPKIDQLPPALQPFLFDCAVNHGPARAVKFLQQALRELGCVHLKVDGKIGPKTRDAAHYEVAEFGERSVLDRLIDCRRQFYYAISVGDPSQKVFLKGWLNRLAEFERAEEEPAMRDGSQLVEAMCKHVYEQAMRRIWTAQGLPETTKLTTWNVLDAEAQMEWRLQMQDALVAIAEFERKEGPDPAAQLAAAKARIEELEAALAKAFDRGVQQGLSDI